MKRETARKKNPLIAVAAIVVLGGALGLVFGAWYRSTLPTPNEERASKIYKLEPKVYARMSRLDRAISREGRRMTHAEHSDLMRLLATLDSLGKLRFCGLLSYPREEAADYDEATELLKSLASSRAEDSTTRFGCLKLLFFYNDPAEGKRIGLSWKDESDEYLRKGYELVLSDAKPERRLYEDPNVSERQ
ncbi:MAG: hypothetical protein LCH41_04185 [Armatimonadetes bacterium]|nr:hypothetical protein [Armatimonadota bacterium]